MGCVLVNVSLKNGYKMIRNSKQQAIDADPKTIQQINFKILLEI